MICRGGLAEFKAPIRGEACPSSAFLCSALSRWPLRGTAAFDAEPLLRSSFLQKCRVIGKEAEGDDALNWKAESED